jgi:hypothetical protein
MDTIFWVVPQEINTATFATIYKVDYDIWHKRLGHPSKDVLKRAKELKDFPNDLVFPEHSPLCRGCAEGIQSRTSVPHMHQQNGHAECFNRTLMDKAQAMRLDACLPPSWWEFVVNTATHLYNRTPV